MLLHKASKRGHNFLIDRTLERNDQGRQSVHISPSPCIEFGPVLTISGRMDVDFAFLALEPHGEPFLCLTTITPLPTPLDDVVRKIITEPIRRFGNERGTPDIRFFPEFAERGIARIFSLIDPALRHLPRMVIIDMLWACFTLAAANKHLSVPIEKHNAHARAVGK